jgi:hypothetical protein
MLAVGFVLSSASAAQVPTPPGTGCPGGYTVLSVGDLVEQGYIRIPDTNGDGHVCGKPVAAPVQAQICDQSYGGVCPVPTIYMWRDNNVTAR